MDLSICLISWNTREDLVACLHSIELYAEISPEILVVDNASSDGSAEMVRQEFPSVKLIANTSNRGFAAAANQAMEKSSGRYLLLMNPDSLLQSSLKPLIEFADVHLEIGVLGGKILNPDESIQYSCRTFPHPVAALFRHTLLGKLWPKNPFVREYLLSDWDHDSFREVDWVSGAFMLVRKEMTEKIGFFDERFFMYSEDMDLCYRAHEARWKVAFFPGAVMTHAIGRSSDQAPFRMTIQFHRSMYRFFIKHYARRYNFIMRFLLGAAVVFRCLLILASRPFNHSKR